MPNSIRDTQPDSDREGDIRARAVALDGALEIVPFNIGAAGEIGEGPGRELCARLIGDDGMPLDADAPQDGIYRDTGQSSGALWRLRVFKASEGGGHGILIRLDLAAEQPTNREESSALLHAAFSQAPIELNIRDRHRRYVMVNSGVEKYFGLDPEDMIGKRSDEVFDPAYGSKYDDDVDKVMRTGKPVYLFETGVAPDFRLLNLLTIKFPVRNDRGDVDYVAAMSVDVDGFDADLLRLRGVLDAVSSGVFICSEEKQIIAANRIGREILLDCGLSEAETLGQLHMDTFEITDVHGAAIPFEERPCVKAAMTGRPTPERILSLSVPGAEPRKPDAWFEVTSFPLKDRRGAVHGVIIFLNPCDERVRLMEAKRETDRHFWLLSRNIGEMIALVDSNGVICEASASFEWGAEYTPEELVGRRFDDFFPDERAPGVQESFDRATTKGVQGPHETLFRRADGTYLPVDMTVVRADPEVSTGKAKYVVSLRNITRRQQAEQDRLVFKTVLDHTSQAAAIIDRDTGSLHYANEAFFALCGSAREGQAWRNYIADRSAPGVRDLAQALWNNRSWVGVIPARNVDTGRKFPMRCNVDFAPTSDLGGVKDPIPFIFLLCEDHSLEMERSRALESAIEAERSANREKARLIRTMTHDLRQPVFAMGLLAHSVSQALPDMYRDRADALQRSVQHLDRMLDSLGQMTALNLKEVTPEIRSVDVNGLLRHVAQEARYLAEHGSIAIQIDCGAEPFRTDVMLLGRILRNLVLNAIEHAGADRITIIARDHASDAEFVVEDNGKGMPDDIRDLVANELNCGATHSDGVGLGLSIVRQLTELLGGTVSLSSEVGKGSRFAVSIPRR